MDPDRALDDSASDPSRRKRQKVVAACDPCRSRKVKCDGRRPVCQPCQRKYGASASCAWDAGSTRVNLHAPLEYVRRLEDRIRELEDHTMPRQADQQASAQTQVQPMEYSLNTQSDQSTHPPNGAQRMASRERSSAETREPSNRSRRHGSSVDTRIMPAIIGADTGESPGQDFYGSSSAGSFIQQVRRVVEQKTASPSQPRPSTMIRDQDNLPLIVPNEDVGQGQGDCALPTRKRADSLVALYWRYIHTLYPVLGKRMTTIDYESLWRGDGLIPHERSFLCLLNLIFAISSQISPSLAPAERAASSAVFYARAKDLLDWENMASVRYVQIYLLSGLYLQSTNEAHQCWVFVGLAVRTAQSLELHMPETSERLSDTRFKALLRRVWHGCILLDRVLAMTYGRPCMIGRRLAVSVPHPVSVEGERLTPDPDMSQPMGPGENPTLNDFFVSSLSLYDILHDILGNFYSPEAPHILSLDEAYEHYFEASARPRGEFTILEIDRRLSQWKKSIPSFLDISNYPENHAHVSILSRQAVILHQRYLHVHLLSLRPVLSAFIALDSYEREGHPSLQNFLSRRVIFQCSVVCVRIAQEAINLVYKRRTSEPGALADIAEWWYNVLFLYTSATVLIAARLSPFVLSEISETAIFDSWRQVTEALDQYCGFGTSIKRLATTLRLLFGTVPQQFSRFRHLPVEHTAHQQRGALAEVMSAPTVEGLGDGNVAISRLPSPSVFDKHFGDVNSLLSDNDAFLGLNAVFDPNDMSWLTTVPFEM